MKNSLFVPISPNEGLIMLEDWTAQEAFQLKFCHYPSPNSTVYLAPSEFPVVADHILIVVVENTAGHLVEIQLVVPEPEDGELLPPAGGHALELVDKRLQIFLLLGIFDVNRIVDNDCHRVVFPPYCKQKILLGPEGNLQ